MIWPGWTSPVGLGIFLAGLGLLAWGLGRMSNNLK